MTLSDTTVECPTCRGHGELAGFACGPGAPGLTMIHCSICEGAGRVTRERATLLEEAARRRQDRVVRGVSLRDAAAALGITPQELSRLEHGLEPR